MSQKNWKKRILLMQASSFILLISNKNFQNKKEIFCKFRNKSNLIIFFLFILPLFSSYCTLLSLLFLFTLSLYSFSFILSSTLFSSFFLTVSLFLFLSVLLQQQFYQILKVKNPIINKLDVIYVSCKYGGYVLCWIGQIVQKRRMERGTKKRNLENKR